MVEQTVDSLASTVPNADSPSGSASTIISAVADLSVAASADDHSFAPRGTRRLVPFTASSWTMPIVKPEATSEPAVAETTRGLSGSSPFMDLESRTAEDGGSANLNSEEIANNSLAAPNNAAAQGESEELPSRAPHTKSPVVRKGRREGVRAVSADTGMQTSNSLQSHAAEVKERAGGGPIRSGRRRNIAGVTDMKSDVNASEGPLDEVTLQESKFLKLLKTFLSRVPKKMQTEASTPFTQRVEQITAILEAYDHLSMPFGGITFGGEVFETLVGLKQLWDSRRRALNVISLLSRSGCSDLRNKLQNIQYISLLVKQTVQGISFESKSHEAKVFVQLTSEREEFWTKLSTGKIYSNGLRRQAVYFPQGVLEKAWLSDHKATVGATLPDIGLSASSVANPSDGTNSERSQAPPLVRDSGVGCQENENIGMVPSIKLEQA
ncbi:hypothetical protein HDU93_001441 [Gonapodya sp. JEL0774]|nr:hypothetical protein HDU93_001441 [Gonapodya sp. JEL0774]